MDLSRGKILAGLLVVCLASVGSAQNQGTAVHPHVAFPPTPTPAPKEEPLTPEKLDSLIVPTQFLNRTSDVLSIVYNGFRRSQVDPCGCVTHQLGGLDKEARIIKRIDDLKLPMLELDAGGFMRDMPDHKMVTQSKYLLKGLGMVGYDAVNVGYTDLALTPDELKETAKEAGIKLVSANIENESGELAFDPYLIKDVKLKDGSTLKVGIVGVTRPRVVLNGAGSAKPVPVTAGSAEGSSATLQISDPTVALNKYVGEVAKKSDFVVILDYDRRSNAEKIVNGLQDKSLVDVLITGENSQILGSVQALGNVQVVSGGYEGRQVGTLYIELNADHKIVSTWNKHIEVLQTIPPVATVSQLIEETHEAVTPANAKGTSVPAPTRLNLSTE